MADEQETGIARAIARYVRMSPSKVRRVASLIKGRHVDDARRILAFSPTAAAREISRVLESAVANAEHNLRIPQDQLVVRSAVADDGPTMARVRPRAQGRAYRIRKRTTHISVVLERMEGVESPVRVPEARTRRRRAHPEEEAPAEGADETPKTGKSED